jgi:hypothetical protein
MLIQDQAQCLFVNIKAKCGKCAAAAETLTDSHVVFHGFKASVNVHYTKVSGEAVCADTAVWEVSLRLCNKSRMKITCCSRCTLSALQDYFGCKCQIGRMLQR